MEILTQIKDFAEQAHGGQMRKYDPEPFIQHPIRVMNTCKLYSSDTALLGAALLHDVLEDTSVTKNELCEFLKSISNNEKWAERTLQLVVELTDVYIKDNYPRLNRRKRKKLEAERLSKTSAEAQTIKYADIIDNCSSMQQSDPDFAQVYFRESRDLVQVMTKGNSDLREKAFQVLNKESGTT